MLFVAHFHTLGMSKLAAFKTSPRGPVPSVSQCLYMQILG